MDELCGQQNGLSGIFSSNIGSVKWHFPPFLFFLGCILGMFSIFFTFQIRNITIPNGR